MPTKKPTMEEVRDATWNLIFSDLTNEVREAIAQTIFNSFAVDGITHDPDESIANKAFSDADECLKKLRARERDTYITYSVSPHYDSEIRLSFQNAVDPSMTIHLSGGIDEEDGTAYLTESHTSRNPS